MDSEGNTGGDNSEDNSESSFLGGIFDALSSGLSSISNWLQEGFASVTTGITQSISNLKTAFDNIGTWLQDGFKNIVDGITENINNLKEVFGTIGTFIKDGFKNIVDGITQSIEDLKTTIDNIVTNIKEMLKDLFVPEGEVLQEVINLINSKFPIINEIKTFFEELEVSGTTYDMNITMRIYGQEIEIVDLSWIQYKSWYKTFRDVLVVFIYVKYFISFYKKLPRIIKGGA